MTRRPVVQITPYYPPHLGGLERVVQELARQQSNDREVSVLTTDAGATAGGVGERGFRVNRCHAVEIAHTPIAPGLLPALLRAPRDAVWHLHAAHALLPELVLAAAKLRRTRYLVHFHLDVDASGRFGGLLPAYKRHVFGPVLRAAAGVIVLTEDQAEFVRTTYRVPAGRVFVVPNGVGAEFFQPVRARAGGPLRVLFVGRLSAQKNVARLIDALALTETDIALDIVGDGELRPELEARAGRANVAFHGRLDGEELRARLLGADVFVLPSDKEGMPLAALEAMAAGLAVVATRVPGNIELLDGVGLLTEPTPAGLAKALDAVASDETLRWRLAEASAARAGQFTWHTVARRVDEVYDKVYAGAPR